MFDKLKKKMAESNQKASQRGQSFANALNVDSVKAALDRGAYVPAMLVLDDHISDPQYGGQENLLLLQILPSEIVFTNPAATKKAEISLAADYALDLSLIKRPSNYMGFPSVEIYVLLEIVDHDTHYKILWSDFAKLPELLKYLANKQIKYTIPDYYQTIFSETPADELRATLTADDRFKSQLIPELPPTAMPHPLK